MYRAPQLLALPDVARAITRQLVARVAEAHARGLVHRCVKEVEVGDSVIMKADG